MFEAIKNPDEHYDKYEELGISAKKFNKKKPKHQGNPEEEAWALLEKQVINEIAQNNQLPAIPGLTIEDSGEVKEPPK